MDEKNNFMLKKHLKKNQTHAFHKAGRQYIDRDRNNNEKSRWSLEQFRPLCWWVGANLWAMTTCEWDWNTNKLALKLNCKILVCINMWLFVPRRSEKAGEIATIPLTKVRLRRSHDQLSVEDEAVHRFITMQQTYLCSEYPWKFSFWKFFF